MIDAMFRVWGKDLRAGTAVIPGNPFIVPGTAIRAHNFGLFDKFIFRVEAVTHKFTAAGSSKGFKTSLAFAEPDEIREAIQDQVYDSIKAKNGKGIFVQGSELAEKDRVINNTEAYQRVKSETPGQS